MNTIPPAPAIARHVVDAAELEHAPAATIAFGPAPDGLPWLLTVDRSARLDLLFRTVLNVFELPDRSQLPDSVRDALETGVAAGLMGVHEVDGPGGPARVFVTRAEAKQVLGPTLLSQMLDPPPVPSPMARASRQAITNPVPTAAAPAPGAPPPPTTEDRIDAVEHSIEERQSRRHLLIDLESGAAFTAGVRSVNNPLREPNGPLRPLVFEDLRNLDGVEARIQAGSGSWSVQLADEPGYREAIRRAHQAPGGGSVSFEVPRVSVLTKLVELTRGVGELHRRSVVHGDLGPSNVLFAADGPLAFDSLDIEAGSAATAANFEWASPEQIVGLPVDPRADVFALARLVTKLLDGVMFGEETRYIMPVGGGASRSVKLLKAEGVFIDVLGTDHDRRWQMAWQELLGAAVSYDADDRPTDADAFAVRLAELVAQHPPDGTISCVGFVGAVAPADDDSFARVVSDIG